MKRFFLLFTIFIFYFCFNIAYAGEWIYTPTGGWYYQSDKGAVLKNEWVWIDTDKDGYEERYYFGRTGELLVNARTPDGLFVNEKGEWVIDGIVQLRKVVEETAENKSLLDQKNQTNVVQLAKSFLAVEPFSRKNLIATLKQRGYSSVVAIYGADNSGANWNEEALKKAKIYIARDNFTSGNLTNILIKDGFTEDEIKYALQMLKMVD